MYAYLERRYVCVWKEVRAMGVMILNYLEAMYSYICGCGLMSEIG